MYRATPQEAFEIKPVNSANIVEITERNRNFKINNTENVEIIESEISPKKPFIEANTIEVDLQHLSNDCTIPVFSKDNELTIAHQQFIETVMGCVNRVFPHEVITQPDIRVSHQYYERMMFAGNITSIKDTISGNELTLSFGGVRSYNLENLYSKKTMERFKFFIGFQNKVCSNMCVWSDGFISDLRVSSVSEMEKRITQTMQEYNAELHLMEMKELTYDTLSEHQFAQLIGKCRLYQHLPKQEKAKISELLFNDSHINLMAKGYYEDENFSRNEEGRINLWDVYNLFTQANKSSYIDSFLDRNLNAFEFSKGIQKTLNGNSNYHWFLS